MLKAISFGDMSVEQTEYGRPGKRTMRAGARIFTDPYIGSGGQVTFNK